jgi:hypothetical protein
MINTIKNLFGFGQKVNYADLFKQGAVIVDVRSKKANIMAVTSKVQSIFR